MLRTPLTHTDISIGYKSLFLADFALFYSLINYVSTFTAKNARSVSSTSKIFPCKNLVKYERVLETKWNCHDTANIKGQK
jgi:hypothetical protein